MYKKHLIIELHIVLKKNRVLVVKKEDHLYLCIIKYSLCLKDINNKTDPWQNKISKSI